MDKLLSTREVAKILGVHINTVRRWSDNHLIDCYRLGPRKDRRFSKDDISKFLTKEGKIEFSENLKEIREKRNDG